MTFPLSRSLTLVFASRKNNCYVTILVALDLEVNQVVPAIGCLDDH